MEALIESEKLNRSFGGRAVVEDLNLSLKRGDILGLLGPNGAGKSTTLRMLCGDLAPSDGNIRICHTDLLKNPAAAKQQLGYLPERPPLHDDQRVDEFLADCARLRRLPNERIKEIVQQTKQRCGLSSVGKRLIRNLSKGFQQRVGIAQAIQHNPSVVILDEPTDGLDPSQIGEVRELIRQLAMTSGVILSSHILPEIQAVCNRVMILQDGKTVYDGEITPPQTITLKVELTQNPDAESIAALHPVAAVERLHTDYFRVTLKPDADRAEFAKQVVERDWGLRELTPETLSLEQIFMQATGTPTR